MRAAHGLAALLAVCVSLTSSAIEAAPAVGVGERLHGWLGTLRAEWQRRMTPAWRVVGEEAVVERGRAWQRVQLEAIDPNTGAQLAAGVVWLLVPPGATRFALGLPGWRLAAIDHERVGGIGKRAMAQGIALVLAEMQTTVYEEAVVSEARRDRIWCGADCQMGGLAWIRWVVLPWAESRVGAVAGVFGVSTGGRGAMSVAQFVRPGIAVCAASGTFDLAALVVGTGEYSIHANAWGERRKWSDRWAAHDNVRHAQRAVGSRVLFWHGGADAIVPAAQSVGMAQALKAAGGDVTVRVRAGAGHDWGFWRGAMGGCVDFIAGVGSDGER